MESRIDIPEVESKKTDSKVTFSEGNEESPSKSKQRKKSQGFGVKSYLHQFYDASQAKIKKYSENSFDENNDIEEWSEDEDYHYLIGPGHKKKKCCCCCSIKSTQSSTTMCWKIGLWSGLNLLILGAILLLVGYLAPRSNVIVGHQLDLQIIDKSAQKFNHNLDVCKVAGVGILICGAAVLSIALLLPSFLLRYSEVDFGSRLSYKQEPFKWKLESERGEVESKDSKAGPTSAGAKIIPVTEELTEVQPTISPTERTISTRTGLAELK